MLTFNYVFAGYEEGVQAKKSGDYSTAFREFLPLAEQGDAIAQFELGDLYHEGKGIPINDNLALPWLIKSANQGNIAAQIFVASIAYNQKNYVLSAEWHTKLAIKGYPDSMFYLGELYRMGAGVPKNLETSVFWFKSSAEKGEERAQFGLGAAYYQGFGIEKDLEKANFWFKKAVDSGNKDAQTMLDFIEVEKNSAEKLLLRWSKFSSTSDSALYIDFSSLHKNGNLVKVWEMLDWAKPKGNALSMKILQKFDCDDDRLVFLGFTSYSKNMGKGDVVSSKYKLESADWKPVMPDSNQKNELDTICAKK